MRRKNYKNYVLSRKIKYNPIITTRSLLKEKGEGGGREPEPEPDGFK